MKVFVTGGGGMLATAVAAEFRSRGDEVIAPARAQLDVTSPAAVDDRLASELPDVVVQCAAYTAVDAAESDFERASLVNATATGYLAAACDRTRALLVYPSTDYVFRGDASEPYSPSHPTNPVNAYGRSKAAGEEAALASPNSLVVRTSWLYGPGGPNFVSTMLRRAREGAALRVVADQIGRPTWTVSLAGTIAGLVEAGARGVYHATDEGDPVSWYGFALEIVAAGGVDARVEPVGTRDWPTAAPRPAYSVLDCSATARVLGRAAPDWRTNLHQHLRRSAVPA